MRSGDAVRLVELAYDLDASDADWLGALAEAARPALDRGLGMFGMVFGAPGFTAPVATLIDSPAFVAVSQELMANPSPAIVHAFTSSTAMTSMRAKLATMRGELAAWDRVAGKVGVRDIVGVLAHDGEGGAINLGGVSPHNERISGPDRERWSRIAAHIGAALRIRRRTARGAEVVLSRRGHVEDAPASLRDDRELTAALQEATRNMVHARGRLRRDDAALAIWPSMVRGRWTLVEPAAKGGTPHVEAHANVPASLPLADLTPIERACAELVRRGHANKEIAYALGLSEGSISRTLTFAMRKLGVRTRVGLVALGDAPSLADVERVLGDTATRAEVAVAALAVAGMSNAAIAAQRGVAPRTIANQLARLFDRVGVASRTELAALIQARRRKP